MHTQGVSIRSTAGKTAEQGVKKSKVKSAGLSATDTALASVASRDFKKTLESLGSKSAWLFLEDHDLVVRSLSGSSYSEVRLACVPGQEAAQAPTAQAPLEISNLSALISLVSGLAAVNDQLGLRWDGAQGQLVLRAGKSTNRLRATQLSAAPHTWTPHWPQGAAGRRAQGEVTEVSAAELYKITRVIDYARSRAEGDGWMIGCVLERQAGRLVASATNRFQIARASVRCAEAAEDAVLQWQVVFAAGAPERLALLCQTDFTRRIKLSMIQPGAILIEAAGGEWTILITTLSQRPGNMIERLMNREPTWRATFERAELARVFAGALIVESRAGDTDSSTQAWTEGDVLKVSARADGSRARLEVRASEVSGEDWSAGVVASMLDRAIRMPWTSVQLDRLQGALRLTGRQDQPRATAQNPSEHSPANLGADEAVNEAPSTPGGVNEDEEVGQIRTVLTQTPSAQALRDWTEEHLVAIQPPDERAR